MKIQYVLPLLLIITAGITVGFAWMILSLVLSYCFYLYHRQVSLDFRAQEAEIMKSEKEARFTAVLSKHGILSWNSGEIAFWTKQTPAPIRTSPPAEIPETEPGPADTQTLFDVLKNRDRILIIGGMGAGKSELLKWLSNERAKEGELMILDSHAAPDTWPVGEVVGLGRDYPAIERAVRSVCAEQDRRYQQRAAGTRKNFPQLCMVIDEMSILNMFADLSGEFKSLLCECRKVNIKLIVGGQSDRAGAMGLKGNYDLMHGFDAVCQLEVDADGRHYGAVKIGKSENTYPHPGIFIPPFAKGGRGDFTGTSCRHSPEYPPKMYSDGCTANRDTVTYLPFGTGEKPVVIEEKPVSRVYESRDEKKIVSLYRAGESMNQIAREIWGSSNGRRTAQIKAVLENYGYDFF